MKYLIVLALAAAIVNGLSPEDTAALKKKMMKIGLDCQKSTGANGEDVHQIIQKNVPTRKQGKCLLFCVHKSLNFQNAEGNVNPTGIETWINEMKSIDADMADKMKKVADKCLTSFDNPGDPCESAAIAFDCYMKASKEYGVPMIV